MNRAASRNLALGLALAVLATSAFGLSWAIREFQIYVTKRPIYPQDGRLLSTITAETPGWVKVGSDHKEDADVEITLGTRNYLTRMYAKRGPDGKPLEAGPVIQLHAAYYTGMIDTVPHVPERCFVGGGLQIGQLVGDLPLRLDQTGWRPVENLPPHRAGQVFEMRVPNWAARGAGTRIRLPRNPQDLKLRTMAFLSDRADPLYAGYFFIANGGAVSRAEEVRLLAFNLNDYYAYYLKIQFTSVKGISSGEELAEAGADLLSELMGDIMQCVPDWTRVESGEYPEDNPLRAKPSGGT